MGSFNPPSSSMFLFYLAFKYENFMSCTKSLNVDIMMYLQLYELSRFNVMICHESCLQDEFHVSLRMILSAYGELI